MRRLLISLIVIGLLFIPITTYSTIINVPSEQPTIQAGIDATVDGDTVLVADGTYTGEGNRDIDLLGKKILLTTESGPEYTIIDCEGTITEHHRGFYFHNSEDSNTVVSGFTITNGYADMGGGILCDKSDPILINNIIFNNRAGLGGGIYFENSSPQLLNSIIKNNFAVPHTFDLVLYPGYGGGISLHYSKALISNCQIIGNRAEAGGSELSVGGGIDAGASKFTLSNSIIYDNSAELGGGIFLYMELPEIKNNVIRNNKAIKGGAVYLDSSYPTFENNTVVKNIASNGSFVNIISGNIKVSNCIISFNNGSSLVDYDLNGTFEFHNTNSFENETGDWTGYMSDYENINNNISLDPLFCDILSNNYELDYTSPCLPDNNNSNELIGAFGVGCSNILPCGDINEDYEVNSNDILLLESLYSSCSLDDIHPILSDLNCDDQINILDIVYLNNYLYSNGPEPCCGQ